MRVNPSSLQSLTLRAATAGSGLQKACMGPNTGGVIPTILPSHFTVLSITCPTL
jgi:hypothetical protein